MRCVHLAIFATFISIALAHDDHSNEQERLGTTDDWATRHMQEEHHIDSFDSDTFFKLHDFDSTGFWSPDDIKRMYGLFDRSAAHISEADKDSVVTRILALYDRDNSGKISHEEFTEVSAKGVALPDLGFGPGHHGDDEYEYEIHHWEKYHSGPDVKIEDLTHPEDIEHFRMHEEEELAQEVFEEAIAIGIVEKNIPRKFLRDG